MQASHSSYVYVCVCVCAGSGQGSCGKNWRRQIKKPWKPLSLVLMEKKKTKKTPKPWSVCAEHLSVFHQSLDLSKLGFWSNTAFSPFYVWENTVWTAAQLHSALQWAGEQGLIPVGTRVRHPTPGLWVAGRSQVARMQVAASAPWGLVASEFWSQG